MEPHFMEVFTLATEDWVKAQKILKLPSISLMVVKLNAQRLVLLQCVHNLLHQVAFGFRILQELQIPPNILLTES